MEAVERICSCKPTLPIGDDKPALGSVFDLLSGLDNKSLVSIDISDYHCYIRYFMLEAIKEYASEKIRE